jgi:phage terminase Nu1 subunit (DNA packaging protein)
VDNTVNADRLGKMLGITERQVRNQAKAGLFDRTGRGQYNVDDCVRAYIRYREEQLKGDSESLTDQRTRLVRAQADTAELDLEIKRGNNIPIDLCKSYWQSVLGAVRSKMLSIPSSLKTKFPHLENDAVVSIDESIRDILSEVSQTGIPSNLSKRLERYAGDVEAAAEDDGESVG